ncbi:MAG: hypothetical protein KatS3mg031_0586 [Chitinophagales bacterium]|nr:MAG: hypothetical protein KatS3mg031_0586 [Chitinophagales bacterium]
MDKLLIMLFVWTTRVVAAQPFGPLLSDGYLPEYVLHKLTGPAYNKAFHPSGRMGKDADSRFLLETTFSSTLLFKSGQVLVNDPVGKYVNLIAKEVLKANPELQGTFRFYVVKSPVANAISTYDSTVFVHVGLIARLENEAQLAFILCHELAHCIRQDVLERYVHSNQLRNAKGAYKNLPDEVWQLEQKRFSLATEIAADREAYRLFSRTAYPPSEALAVIRILQHTEYHSAPIPFNFTLLESDHFHIPTAYKDTMGFFSSSSASSGRTGAAMYDLQHRIDTLRQLIQQTDKSKNQFLVSQEQFQYIKTLATYELLRQEILNRNYESAIYRASILLNRFPDDYYLKEALGRALLGLAFYAGTEDFSNVHLYPDESPAYLRQVSYLFEQLNKHPVEAAVVALHYFLRLRDQYPEKHLLDYYISKLLHLLSGRYDVRPEIFSNSAPPSKAPKDDRKKYETTIPQYCLSFLQAYLNQPWIRLYFEKSHKETFGIAKSSQQESLSTKRKGQSLSIDTLIQAEPFYAVMDERKQITYRYVESEKGQENLSDKIVKIADELKLHIIFMDTRHLSAADIERYNEFCFLHEYISERLQHPDYIPLSLIERQPLQQLKEKYGTPYVNLTALIYNRKTRRLLWPLTYTVLFPVALPLTLPKIIAMGKSCFFVNLLYNIDNDELVFMSSTTIQSADRSDLISAHVYYTLKQIKAERK